MALLALSAPLYFWSLGDYPLDNHGEPREGTLAQEMVERGEWLLPRPNGTRWPEKPLLFPWLGALASVATGGTVTEGTLRFPSAFLSVLGIGLAWLLARRGGGRGEAALAAATLALALGWIGVGRHARIDVTLAVLMEAALYAFLRAYQSERNRGAWGLATALALALATLAKGPMGAIFPLAAIAAVLALRAALDRAAPAPAPPLSLGAALRREAGLAAGMRPLLGTILFSALVLAWYVPAGLRGGWEFIDVVLLRENVEMPLGRIGAGGHPHPPWWYLQYLFVAFAPASLFLPVAAVWQARRARRAPRIENLLPLAWAGVFLAGLSVASGKRYDYLVILLPALALLTAPWLSQALDAQGRSRLWLEVPVAALALAALLGAVSAAGVEAVPRTGDGAPALRLFGSDALLSRARSGILGPALVQYHGLLAALLALLGLVWGAAWLLFRRGRSRAAAGLTGAAALAAGITAVTTFLPLARDAHNLEPFARQAAAFMGPALDSDRVASVNDFNFALLFYLRAHVAELPAEAMKPFLARGGRRFCILTGSVWGAHQARLGGTAQVLLQSDYEDERGHYLLIGPAGTQPMTPLGR